MNKLATSSSRYRSFRGEFIEYIPAHWNDIRIKFICSSENSGVYGAEMGESDFDLPVCTTAHISSSGELLVSEMPVRSFTSDDVSRYQGQPGDIFVVKSSGSNTNIVSGKLTLINGTTPPVIFSNFLFRLRPTLACCDPEYLAFFLQSSITRERIKKMVSTTTYPNISVEEYVGAVIPLPPIEEQRQIAESLKAGIYRLDKLIAEKQRVSNLLTEKRRALLGNFLTQGLNKDTPRRDSGISWLGEIPAHWQIERAKWLFREIDDRSTTGDETLLSLRMEKGLVPHNDVSAKVIPPSELIGYKRACQKQIVVNRMRAASGLIAIVPQDGIVSPDYAVFEPIGPVDPEFFALLFQTPLLQAVFRSESKGLGTGQSGFLRLYSENFLSLHFPVPPLNEQQTIVAHAQIETKKLNNLVEATERTIELLQERRSALISAAVTGQMIKEVSYAS